MWTCGLEHEQVMLLSGGRLRFVMVLLDCDPMTMMAKAKVGTTPVMWQLAVQVALLVLLPSNVRFIHSVPCYIIFS